MNDLSPTYIYDDIEIEVRSQSIDTEETLHDKIDIVSAQLLNLSDEVCVLSRRINEIEHNYINQLSVWIGVIGIISVIVLHKNK